MVQTSPLTKILMSLMGLVGFVQVTWALMHVLMTAHRRVRNHFGCNGAGVGAYFLLLYLMEVLWETDTGVMRLRTHFFLSAGLLCCYHFWIVSLARRLDRAEIASFSND